MPAHLKLRPRMRRLLSPAVTQAEWIGIIAWTGIGWMQATLFDMSMLSITSACCLFAVFIR